MSATPLFGQTGAGGARSASGDRLSGSLGVGAAFDSQPPVALRDGEPVVSQPGGYSTMLTGSGDYSQHNRRITLRGSGTTSFSYDDRLEKLASVGSNVGFDGTLTMPKRSHLELAQTVAFYPSYVSRLFPTGPVAPSGESSPPPSGYDLDNTQSYSYATRLGLGFMAGRNTRVTTTADYGHSSFTQRDLAPPNLGTYGIGTSVSNKLTRRVGLSGGYNFRAGEFGGAGTTREHSVTVGFDYSRPLSASRRATIRVDLSPTMFEIPPGLLSSGAALENRARLEDTAGPIEQRVDGRQQQYRLHAAVNVGYPFRLNWQASFNYDRGLEYLATLTAPVISDAVGAAVNGRLGRHLRVSSTAGYSTGTSTQSLSNQRIKAYTGQTRLSFEFGRSLAAYSEYVFYYYDLRGQPGLTRGLPNLSRQHGLRVGVTLAGSRKGFQ